MYIIVESYEGNPSNVFLFSTHLGAVKKYREIIAENGLYDDNYARHKGVLTDKDEIIAAEELLDEKKLEALQDTYVEWVQDSDNPETEVALFIDQEPLDA